MHVPKLNWKTIGIAYLSKKLGLIKIGSQLSKEKITRYKYLIMKYNDF
jgi:hypothetical protein